MAQIPMGNFGQSVAAPAPMQRVQSEGAGQVVAEANARLAQTGAGIVVDQMQAQHKLDMEQKDLEARTTAARVRVTVANDLSDLRDTVGRGVADGTIEKQRAEEEWNARAKELLEGRMQGVDPRFAGPMQAEFEGMTRQGLNGVRDSVVKRDQTETQANLLNLGEQYQRMAARNRHQAITEYFAQLDAMGPRAGWAPDKIAQAKQQFREGTASTQAFAMVRASSGSIKAIDAAREALGGDEFADLDPQRRAQYDAQLDGYKTSLMQRQEIAAQRAERQREAQLREAGAAYETAQRLVDSGIPLAPEEYERLASKTSGTPYAQGLKAMQDQARAIGGVAAQPIAAQRQALDQVNAQIAQNGASEALVKRRDQLQKIADASDAAAKEDPLRAGLQRGIITELTPLDVRNVDGVVRTIGARLESAKVVQAWASRPVSPLTSDEAKQLSTMLSALPVTQRAARLADLGTALGPQASAGLAALMDKDDKATALALQYGATKTTAGRYTSELILKGQQALKDKAVKVDAMAESGWRATIAKETDGAYSNERQAADVREAAYLITAGLAADGKADPKQAIGLAAGGRIVEHNGRRIPLPAEVDQSQFEDRIRSLTPANFSGQAKDGNVYSGGQAIPLDEFVKSLPDAQLMHAGKDRYTVVSGGRVVTNSQGAPIIIKGR